MLYYFFFLQIIFLNGQNPIAADLISPTIFHIPSGPKHLIYKNSTDIKLSYIIRTPYRFIEVHPSLDQAFKIIANNKQELILKESFVSNYINIDILPYKNKINQIKLESFFDHLDSFETYPQKNPFIRKTIQVHLEIELPISMIQSYKIIFID
jgi:hypothetical protein